MITKNIGRTDQIIRLLISITLVYIGFLDTGIISDRMSANIIGSIGVINLFIAIIRFCPLYHASGINTCQKHAE